MARLINRSIKPGDIIVKINGPGDCQYLMVGEWPGSGVRTLMDLETGRNEQISQNKLEDFRLTTISINFMNEEI